MISIKLYFVNIDLRNCKVMIDLDSMAQSSFNERRFDVMIWVALNNEAHLSLAKTKLLTKWRDDS